MREIATIYLGNDTVIEVAGLKNELTGAFINNATVTVTLKDGTTNADVSGETWPLTLAYVANSNGIYRAILAYDLVLVENRRYKAIISVSAGGLVAEWNDDLVCKKRK